MKIGDCRQLHTRIITLSNEIRRNYRQFSHHHKQVPSRVEAAANSITFYQFLQPEISRFRQNAAEFTSMFPAEMLTIQKLPAN